ncbi:MAG: hypothetical protein P5680_13605 [Limnospira sp. PMC 737.11]|uniref:hypothetical protein n=1 Tax=Limnospira sp. PMC 737.11 TaxID=2981095 RepID=UPI0028E0F738|nr:hypothetical protein [Limnospira sp. PMC 737.11]MDT9275632.1 hypothetical protein [Limnospira sp. PMC 737.11]
MTTNADDVWRLLAELIEAQKETERVIKEESQETERCFRETDRRFREQSEETDRRFEETKQLLQRQSEESDRRFREQSEESDRRFEETRQLLQRQSEESDRRFEETKQLLQRQSEETERIIKQQNEKLNQELGKLGNRLGEFVEWQVRPAVVQLFQRRGIAVNEFHPNISVKRFGEAIEIDLLVVNSDQAILVEVKSKLTETDINEHLERLEKFKRLMPAYRDFHAMGAVAGMVVPEEVASYGYRRGLFVLAQSGDSVVILNDDKFRPRQW